MLEPSPIDRPDFPAEFVEHARRLARPRTVAYHLRQRATLGLLLHAGPVLSNVHAAAAVDLHPNAVRYWRRRWAEGMFSWKTQRDRGAQPGLPPLDHALVKAAACVLVHETRLPLSRLSTTDSTARAAAALGKPISPRTVWRILAADAIKPWPYRDWIIPCAPDCAAKAGRILDLDAGSWHGAPLSANDHLISAEEKTSIQARIRCHPSLPPAPGRAMRIEHAYERGGAFILGGLGCPPRGRHGAV